MNKKSIRKGDRVLIVDDWIETGSQVKSAIRLVEKQNGKVIGIAASYAQKSSKTRILFEKYNYSAINIEKND